MLEKYLDFPENKDHVYEFPHFGIYSMHKLSFINAKFSVLIFLGYRLMPKWGASKMPKITKKGQNRFQAQLDTILKHLMSTARI